MAASVWCKYCGHALVGDDQGGWLHEATWVRQCLPLTYATPRQEYA